ncbi:MAG: TonB-dependent receptor [Prevotellaceae bacterium]|jgi:outer membrane receptor protein involved in Fe transport|nr:TonB-dependent receptor [Prevotellaceae bacterium]
MNRLLALLLFMCSIFATLVAQNTQTTITGRVIEEGSGTAMEAVTVSLYNADSTQVIHASSNGDGIFSLRASGTGNYSLTASSLGYNTLIHVFTIDDNKRNIILPDLWLQASNVILPAVEIVSRKQPLIYKLDRKVIEASGVISTMGGTAVDILSQTPSVKVDAEGEVSFRGSSGFKVHVNGKPASLSGGAALEQIPAGQIENIEIITTPSARYEADGIAGIINIVTRKQTIDGWSGTLNAMASSVMSRNIDFLTSYRKNNINWQTSGEVSRRYMVSDFEQVKTIDISDTLTTTNITGERKSYVDIYRLRSGIEWQPAKTLWSAAGEARYRVRHRGGALLYNDQYLSHTTNQLLSAQYSGKDFVNLHDMMYRGDIGFDHRFADDHRLTGSFFAFYEANAMEFFYTDLFDPSGRQAQGHRAWEYEYRLTAQGNLDWTKSFGSRRSGKIEAGYYFFSYTEDGDYNIDMFDPNSQRFVRHDELYNQYVFRRDIHALYSTLSNSVGKFDYQIGLRGELIHRRLDNNKEWARHVQDKFDLFPSAHIAYSLTDKSRLNAGYSRRITQPQLFYMEPYVVYVDFYTAQCGNPKIRPEYTNSLEMSYSREFGNNSVSATVFHRIRADKIERVRVPYHTGVTLDSMANVGNDYSTGVELTASFVPTKWWGIDMNGSLYRYMIRNEYKNGSDETSENWQLAINNNIDITANTRLRFEAYYVGPSVSTQGRVQSFYYFNLALRQQFFERRLSLGLNIRNVFSTAKYVSTQVGANLYSQTTILPRSPLCTLSLTYTFNNFKTQKAAEKTSHDLFEGTNR